MVLYGVCDTFEGERLLHLRSVSIVQSTSLQLKKLEDFTGDKNLLSKADQFVWTVREPFTAFVGIAWRTYPRSRRLFFLASSPCTPVVRVPGCLFTGTSNKCC